MNKLPKRLLLAGAIPAMVAAIGLSAVAMAQDSDTDATPNNAIEEQAPGETPPANDGETRPEGKTRGNHEDCPDKPEDGSAGTAKGVGFRARGAFPGPRS